jgi:hypothetical protein
MVANIFYDYFASRFNVTFRFIHLEYVTQNFDGTDQSEDIQTRTVGGGI